MRTQGMTDDPFDHASPEAVIDHAAQRLRQRRVADDLFDTGPKAQYGARIAERGEIGDGTAGRVDDVVHVLMRNVTQETGSRVDAPAPKRIQNGFAIVLEQRRRDVEKKIDRLVAVARAHAGLLQIVVHVGRRKGRCDEATAPVLRPG
jgi:hypothetical protein